MRNTTTAILLGAVLTSGIAFAQTELEGSDPATDQSPMSRQTPSTEQSDNVSFINLDANRDGRISRSEAEGHESLVDKFDDADENKDDQLSLSEYQNAEVGGEG